MRKQKTKLVALFCSVMLIFAYVRPDIAYAKEQNQDIRVADILETVLDEIEWFDANVENVPSQEQNRVWSKIQSRLANVGIVTKLEEDGFIESERKVFLPAKIIAINDPDIVNYQFVKVYETENGEMTLLSITYDESTDSLLKVIAQKTTLDGETESYIDYTEYNSSRTRDFNFNGASFACSVAGVLACTSYCVFWGIANVIAGAACDVLCGIAFAAACAIS